MMQTDRVTIMPQNKKANKRQINNKCGIGQECIVRCNNDGVSNEVMVELEIIEPAQQT